MNDRAAVFIDGPNNYLTIKSLNFDVDYSRLRDWLEEEFDPLLRITYYTPVDADDTKEQDIKKLLDFLQYNGFSLFTKPIRSYDNDDRRRQRGEIAIDIAIDIVQCIPHVSTIILFSGDGNLKRAVEIAQANGCRVIVISTNTTAPRSISDDLRRIADEFIEMETLIPVFTREGKTPPVLVKR